MKIEGKVATINKSPEEVYQFLSDFNHFESLMPEQITNWESDEKSCSFTIQGMASVKLIFGTNVPFSHIELLPVGKTPFSFSLHANLTPEGDATKVMVYLDADLNPMLAMMAKRPMENLVNVMAENLKKILG
jgi:carbon monoxide dehydrogenase subunit G